MNCQKLTKKYSYFVPWNNKVEFNRMFAIIIFIVLVIDVMGELSGHDMLN